MATDVAAPLPDITLMPGSTITVTTGNAAVHVTKLVVKVFQVIPSDPVPAAPTLLMRSGR